MTNNDVMAVDARLARLEKTVAKGFFDQGENMKGFAGRMDGFAGRMDGLEGRMDGLEGRMSRLEGRMDGLESRMDGLESRMSGLEDRMGRLEDRMGGLEDRMGGLEDRMAALDSKLDVFIESIRGDLKTVLKAVTALSSEMRRTTGAIRKEQLADRRLTRSILNDQAVRLRELERRKPKRLQPQ